jgi:hypothetical protein
MSTIIVNGVVEITPRSNPTLRSVTPLWRKVVED